MTAVRVIVVVATSIRLVVVLVTAVRVIVVVATSIRLAVVLVTAVLALPCRSTLLFADPVRLAAVSVWSN